MKTGIGNFVPGNPDMPFVFSEGEIGFNQLFCYRSPPMSLSSPSLSPINVPSARGFASSIPPTLKKQQPQNPVLFGQQDKDTIDLQSSSQTKTPNRLKYGLIASIFAALGLVGGANIAEHPALEPLILTDRGEWCDAPGSLIFYDDEGNVDQEKSKCMSEENVIRAPMGKVNGNVINYNNGENMSVLIHKDDLNDMLAKGEMKLAPGSAIVSLPDSEPDMPAPGRPR